MEGTAYDGMGARDGSGASESRRGGYDCRLIWNAAWGDEPVFPRAVLEEAGGGQEKNPYEPADTLPANWQDRARGAVLPPLSVLAGRVWQLSYDELREVIEHLYCCRRAQRVRSRTDIVREAGNREGERNTSGVKTASAPPNGSDDRTTDDRHDGSDERTTIERRIREVHTRLRRLL